jgi:glycine/D-amino acid oxidase-like deaminating enzyme
MASVRGASRSIENSTVKWVSYWLDTAPATPDYSLEPLPNKVDIAIIGGGFTGLSAAIHAARKGANVALLEQETFGWGASGRNGGMCTTGATISYLTLIHRYGIEQANRLYRIYNDAIDLVEQLATKEGFGCHFARTGKMSLASKPDHFARFERTHEALAEHLGYETRLLSVTELRDEIGSDIYHGGLVDTLGAGLHVGKFAKGLARVAEGAGVRLHEKAKVLGLSRVTGSTYDVRTSRGTLHAAQVLLATDGYTDSSIPRFRRRIIPVGSFIIATEPLGQRVADELMPTRRMASDSKNLLYYFRITPDNRLLFGGRAQWALSNPDSDRKSAAILHAGMLQVFPQLRDATVEYAWGGQVGMTLDRIPHAGEHEGLFYSMGYCGHGVQMSTYMGRQMVEAMDGHPDANPWREFEFKAVPFHFGPPWFLPIADAYYRMKDKLS